MVIEENPFDHILYEFSMYLKASLMRCSDQFIINLMVDSRLVHMRNLAYFFCEQSQRDKKYLHYSMYISGKKVREVDQALFKEVQKITSNATCHLLKGRLNDSFKQETLLFEQRVFPIFVSMIKDFILELDRNINPTFKSNWENEIIQVRAKELKQLIQNYEAQLFKINHTITSQ